MAEMNLWRETANIIAEHGRSWDDVDFVCRNTYCIPKTCFENLAISFDYDNGFGRVEVPIDLKVVSKDRTWWLTRREYDGKECWQFNICPECPTNTKTISSIVEDDVYPL